MMRIGNGRRILHDLPRLNARSCRTSTGSNEAGRLKMKQEELSKMESEDNMSSTDKKKMKKPGKMEEIKLKVSEIQEVLKKVEALDVDKIETSLKQLDQIHQGFGFKTVEATLGQIEVEKIQKVLKKVEALEVDKIETSLKQLDQIHQGFGFKPVGATLGQIEVEKIQEVLKKVEALDVDKIEASLKQLDQIHQGFGFKPVEATLGQIEVEKIQKVLKKVEALDADKIEKGLKQVEEITIQLDQISKDLKLDILRKDWLKLTFEERVHRVKTTYGYRLMVIGTVILGAAKTINLGGIAKTIWKLLAEMQQNGVEFPAEETDAEEAAEETDAEEAAEETDAAGAEGEADAGKEADGKGAEGEAVAGKGAEEKDVAGKGT